MKMILFLLALLLLGSVVFIRFAPFPVEKAHISFNEITPPKTANYYLLRGDNAVILESEKDITKIAEILQGIILKTPRTEHIAGVLIDEGATYITRSKWMRYPDYSTVRLRHNENGEIMLEIFARARFGLKDFNVNRVRVEKWRIELKKQIERA